MIFICHLFRWSLHGYGLEVVPHCSEAGVRSITRWDSGSLHPSSACPKEPEPRRHKPSGLFMPLSLRNLHFNRLLERHGKCILRAKPIVSEVKLLETTSTMNSNEHPRLVHNRFSWANSPAGRCWGMSKPQQSWEPRSGTELLLRSS